MTSKNNDIHALDSVSDDIEEAIAAADWARIQTLEALARPLMAAASEAAQAGDITVELVVERLQRLQTLFEAARTGAVKARDEASVALKTSEKTHQAAQAYLKNARR